MFDGLQNLILSKIINWLYKLNSSMALLRTAISQSKITHLWIRYPSIFVFPMMMSVSGKTFDLHSWLGVTLLRNSTPSAFPKCPKVTAESSIFIHQNRTPETPKMARQSVTRVGAMPSEVGWNESHLINLLILNQDEISNYSKICSKNHQTTTLLSKGCKPIP